MGTGEERVPERERELNNDEVREEVREDTVMGAMTRAGAEAGIGRDEVLVVMIVLSLEDVKVTVFMMLLLLLVLLFRQAGRLLQSSRTTLLSVPNIRSTR